MAINLSLILVQKLRFLLRGVKSGDSAFYPLFFLYFFKKIALILQRRNARVVEWA